MGTGIKAAIPLTFIPEWRFRAEYFTEGFFDNFDIVENNGKKLYTIKQELLINNYKLFLSEFYDLIGEKLDVDALPNIDSIDELRMCSTTKNETAIRPTCIRMPLCSVRLDVNVRIIGYFIAAVIKRISKYTARYHTLRGYWQSQCKTRLRTPSNSEFSDKYTELSTKAHSDDQSKQTSTVYYLTENYKTVSFLQ